MEQALEKLPQIEVSMITAKRTTTENGEISLRHLLIESARPAMKILLDQRAHS